MCGIGGIIETRNAEGPPRPVNFSRNEGIRREQLEKRLLAMQQALHHRGPDDQGLFISKERNAGLVNTRLAILDLTAAGHQPMTSGDGRDTIVFNGEVYNYGALRQRITDNKERLTSNSDTEVVLALFRQLGLKCLDLLEGMFAFAIWDEQEQSCFLARDPLGIKPLYYYAQDGLLCFASEIQALLKTGLVDDRLSNAGVGGYLMYGSVQEPYTLMENVRMLPAGHFLTWKDGEAKLTKYWEVHFGSQRSDVGCQPPAHSGLRPGGMSDVENAPSLTFSPPGRDEEDKELRKSEGHASACPGRAEARPPTDNYAVIVRAALDESIERHLVSDVPVGVFLSGGIDSTTIVALASQKVKESLRTFSISFDDPAFDEGTVAAKTAAHFGTQHTDWRLDADTAKELLFDFLKKSDQPSIDGFNTFCVSKMAHDHGLKVVLSGLGGDEVFGGYRSFELIPGMMRASRRINALSPMRSVAGRLMEFAGSSPRARRLGCFLQKAPDLDSAYWCMRGIFARREVNRLLPLFGVDGSNGAAEVEESILPQPTPEDDVSYLELTRYMRNQLLRDSDVMSMAWSLELRVPFADRKLIETVATIPAAWRLASGKQMLLDAVPEIPEWVRNRPKQGFTFPFKDWVTTQWRDVFERLEKESPVSLKSWYRAWCLFALEKFCEKLNVRNSDCGFRISE